MGNGRSCILTPELYALLEDLANDDDRDTLRRQLTGNRDALLARLGADMDEHLPASGWTLPTREECQKLVERHRGEGRGSNQAEVILNFSAEERSKWA